MTAGLNWIDYVVLGIFFFSIWAGFFRGGVKEVVSLLSWIAAFIVASSFAKPVSSYFSGSAAVQSITSTASGTFGSSASAPVSMFAIGLSFAGLFFGTVIIGSLVGHFVNRAVEGGGVSIANRLLGGVFGLGRGYLINLVIIFMVQLSPLAEQPFWVQSKLVNSFQPAVQWLGNMVEPGIQSLKSSVGQTLQNLNSTFQNQF
ncbi:MAG: colicin V production protein [uncultured bacterium]|nr:MAG: colicin V production protein [uncultured bacterium]